MSPNDLGCKHLTKLDPQPPRSPDGCEECLESGSDWVHLRVCLHCGHVGCCDESPNHHATRHYQKTKHTIVQSFEEGEAWRYCYLDDRMLPDAPKSFR